MTPIELITDNEKDMFLDYIEEYGGDHGGRTEVKASADYILRFWNEEKRDLLQMFGDEHLILSKEISVAKNEQDIMTEMDELRQNSFVRTLDSYSYNAWSYSCYCSEEQKAHYIGKLPKYIERYSEEEIKALRENLMLLVNNRALARNSYNGCTFPIYYGEGENDYFKVERGCKPIRMLGKIVEAWDLNRDEFERYRNAHSLVLNQKKITGELCLSIHPLDYITMSDNECGWSSCMSWEQGGDYRQGTVEMMNSPFIVCAYLKAKNPMRMAKRSDEWSNKRWRCLYIVTPEVIASIRQYPYANEEIDTICLEWLRELSQTNFPQHYGPYTQKPYWIDNMPEGSIQTDEIDEDDHWFYFETNMMYNDMYDERRMYLGLDIGRNIDINYSGESECMCCGELLDEWSETNALTCDNCDPHFRCESCDELCSMDDLVVIGGHQYCSYCVEEHQTECACCGSVDMDYGMRNVWIGDVADDDYHYGIGSKYFCDDCYDEIFKDIPVSDTWRGLRVDLRDITPEFLFKYNYVTKESFNNNSDWARIKLFYANGCNKVALENELPEDENESAIFTF